MSESMAEQVASELEPLPQDLTAPQLTARAIITGMLLGSLLSLCNIYAGLKVGWGFNMSIIAVLFSIAIWRPIAGRGWARPWGMLENNISQTTASSAASISSAGLVTAIPALTILTGQTLTWFQLSMWTCSVCLIGVFVGAALRRQMLINDPLPFPAGTATAVLLKDLYSGTDPHASNRVRSLLLSGAASGGWLILHTFVFPIKKLYLRIALPFLGRLRDAGITALNTAHLGWGIEPSLLLIGTGILVGTRVSVSLFFGAIIAWGILGPLALVQGWALPAAAGVGAHGKSWYSVVVKWLLWPGVAIMVSAALTSLALSWREILAMFRPSEDPDSELSDVHPSTRIPASVFAFGMGCALVISVFCQKWLFGIPILLGAFSVLIAFFLAVVAARVSGVTGITPKGALGKVSQLSLGLASPGEVSLNLMAANVTAGGAAHSADILHDLKTGYLVGGSPRSQLIGQLFGIISGALVGSAVYLWLIPNPSKQLMTPEWPAPAVAVWKSVAELLKLGLKSMPTSALIAGCIGIVLGIAMAVVQQKLPSERRKWFPSPAAFGLAFVLPATASATIFLGGALLWAASRMAPTWVNRYALPISAGLIAGESLFGIISAILKPFFS